MTCDERYQHYLDTLKPLFSTPKIDWPESCGNACYQRGINGVMYASPWILIFLVVFNLSCTAITILAVLYG